MAVASGETEAHATVKGFSADSMGIRREQDVGVDIGVSGLETTAPEEQQLGESKVSDSSAGSDLKIDTAKIEGISDDEGMQRKQSVRRDTGTSQRSQLGAEGMGHHNFSTHPVMVENDEDSTGVCEERTATESYAVHWTPAMEHTSKVCTAQPAPHETDGGVVPPPIGVSVWNGTLDIYTHARR